MSLIEEVKNYLNLYDPDETVTVSLNWVDNYVSVDGRMFDGTSDEIIEAAGFFLAKATEQRMRQIVREELDKDSDTTS